MRLALDTNRYRDIADAVPETADVMGRATEVIVPFATLAEPHHGFRYGSRRAENERRLRLFLLQPIVRIRYADANTVTIWSDLAVDLQRRGFILPHNDLWIAALCVQHGLSLYMRDAHFDHLPQVIRA